MEIIHRGEELAGVRERPSPRDGYWVSDEGAHMNDEQAQAEGQSPRPSGVPEPTATTESFPPVPPPPGPGEGWWSGGWPPVEPPPPPSPVVGHEPRPRRGRALLALATATLVLVSSGIGIGWVLTKHEAGTPTVTGAPLTPEPTTGSSGSPASGLSTQAIAARVKPGVVDINTLIDAVGGQQPRAAAAGTGMVLTSDGEVLTNNHVIAGATSISVTIPGRPGRTPATVLGADPTDDIALLKIQGVTGLATVALANSTGVSIGQRVVAIGNALGQGGSPTVTSGAVSALHQSIRVRSDSGAEQRLSDLIQANVEISPGDSGGPLSNDGAQVVGMITAAARSSAFTRVAHVAYAIPANTALDVVNQIRAGRESDKVIIGRSAFLGVAAQDLDAAAAAQLGLGVSSGALVVEVVPGTPAAKAGITTNSVITAIDGQHVGSSEDLRPLIYRHDPGDRITVTWVDRSGTHSATVTLIAGPAI
jgi:S1-C subfamily serine protease